MANTSRGTLPSSLVGKGGKALARFSPQAAPEVLSAIEAATEDA